MGIVHMSTKLPLIQIQAPKNPDGTDLSDHYPIMMQYPGLKIASYNVQFMPLIIGGAVGKSTLAGITTSVSRIANYFAKLDADVCCVQELFDNTANQLLEKEMLKNGYVATNRVGSGALLSQTNGGARTFVKSSCAKNLTSHEHIYQNCIDYFIGGDATAHKGVVQTSIEKDGHKYHILNTHLQAYYTSREHYAEVTLAQCVELRKFVEGQIAKGIIAPDDTIILCGDFNIPLKTSDQPVDFLFEKMKKILGPKFKILDYETNPEGPKHTLSSNNSYNTTTEERSDLNINVDMFLTCDVNTKHAVVDLELADLYGDIQLAISTFVRSNATLFSGWRLSEKKNLQLEQFNIAFAQLIANADKIKENKKNPLDNPEWFERAVDLLKGPAKYIVQSSLDKSFSDSEPDEQARRTAEPVFLVSDGSTDVEEEIALTEEDDVALDKDQCEKMFNGLVGKLKKIHAEIHLDYVAYGDEYKSVFSASLKLNHALLNEGDKFFSNPSKQSFNHFKSAVMTQITEAEQELSNYPSIWAKVDPLIKKILGVVAAISVLPLLLIMAKSTHGYQKTFFSAPSPTIDEIKDDLDSQQDLSL